MVINKKVSLSVSVTQDSLYEYSRYLTNELCGYPIHEIKDNLFQKLRGEKNVGFNMDLALDIAELALGETEKSGLFIEGIENLLKIPEMVEEAHLNSLLNIIQEKNILRGILEATLENDGVRTVIGSEIENMKVSRL